MSDANDATGWRWPIWRWLSVRSFAGFWQRINVRACSSADMLPFIAGGGSAADVLTRIACRTREAILLEDGRRRVPERWSLKAPHRSSAVARDDAAVV